MTTSNSSNYNATRDQIIQRALRIIQGIAEGEESAISSAALAAATQALNDIVAEFNIDGMPQWNLHQYTCTPLVQGTATYNIGTGSTFNFPAPVRIHQAYMHDTLGGFDTPVLIIDRARYLLLGNKTSQGTPNQLFYQTPRAIESSGESFGEITLYPVPDAYAAANKQLVILADKPLDDFDSATDTLDFPPFWINALVWNLAAHLSYEYGVGLSERAMIEKKAAFHKDQALSFGTEEGSMFFQPEALWNYETKGGQF